MLLPRLEVYQHSQSMRKECLLEVNQVLQILLMSDAWMKAFAEAGMLCV